MYSMKRLKVKDLPIHYQQILELVTDNSERKDFTSELKKLFSEVFNYLEIISIDKNRLEKGERFFDERDLDENGNPIEKIRIKYSENVISNFQVEDTENCIEHYLEKVNSLYEQIEQVREEIIDYIKDDVNQLSKNRFDYTKRFCLEEYKKFVVLEED